MFTAAFPKAGLEVAGVPVPFSLATLVVGLSLVLRRERGSATALSPPMLLTLLLSSVVLTRIALNGATLAEIAATIGWLVLPLAVLQLSITHRTTTALARSAIWVGFTVASVYGVAQLLLGPERLAVPGLTQTAGADLLSKPISIETDSFSFAKVYSTYHNGNNIGAIAAVLLVVEVRRLMRQPMTGQALARLIPITAALLLGGSRTAILAALVGVAAVFAACSGGRMARTALIALAGIVTIGVVLTLQPGLAERYGLSSLTDTAGAGRTAFWFMILSDLSPLEYLFGSTDWLGPSLLPRAGLPPRAIRGDLAEGWVGLIQQVGLVGIVILAVPWYRLARRHGSRLALIPTALIVALDSSYLFFPTLFLIAAIITVEDPARPARPARLQPSDHQPVDDHPTEERELVGAAAGPPVIDLRDS